MLLTTHIDYLLGNMPKKQSKKEVFRGDRLADIKNLLRQHGELHVDQICHLLERKKTTLTASLLELVETGEVTRTFLKPTESDTPGYVYRLAEVKESC